jgi:hypothetical protein
MAIEDDKYEELVACVNALIATGRDRMVRQWLIKLALNILYHYGYQVIEAPSQPPEN